MMIENQYITELDHLAIGLTRSPMFMGVNIKLFFANISLCTLTCIDFHTLLGIPLCVVIHLIMAKCSIKEPNFFYIRMKAVLKTPSVVNKWFWGKTNSYSPW